MKRIRVLFPYVEAGFGHIMPMRAIEETFRKKYGDRVEIVSSEFFKESGDRRLAAYEKMMSRFVRTCNRIPFIGLFLTRIDYIIGAWFSSLFIIRIISPRAYRRGVRHMRELQCDAVFSTHWAPNYYAEHLEQKPLTVLYCPDAELNSLFSYRSDLTLLTTQAGYEKALREKRFQNGNLKLVPHLIRNEAFRTETDKRKIRQTLGLPQDQFTVLLCEGGYGIGRMKALCKRLIRAPYPLTVLAVCGKNEKLLRYLKTLTPAENVTFVPCGFTEEILSYHAASDVFCGKSGTIPAEATFFGNPTIVTSCASVIEEKIARYYVKAVGCAVKAFSARKAAKLLALWAAEPRRMRPYQNAAQAYHNRFGSEEAADLLWAALTDRFGERMARDE